MQTNICLWWFQMAMKYFSFMKKPGGQDVPVILTPISLLAISPRRSFLKWQNSRHNFQKNHSGQLRGTVPADLLWRTCCVPLSGERPQSSPAPRSPGWSLLRAMVKATLGSTAFLGVQHIDQNLHILERGKNKHCYIAQKSHYFNEAFILIV